MNREELEARRVVADARTAGDLFGPADGSRRDGRREFRRLAALLHRIAAATSAPSRS
jgi:hypothetical protein